MPSSCLNCGQSFEILKEDREYYKKITPEFSGKKFPLPDPTECPDCRHQRRMAFRNERKLYKRSCDLCKKSLISLYDEKTPFPVYCYECWWSDDWDALSYGKDYDSSFPFFDQFKELFDAVPRLGIVIGHDENCDYCNYTNYSKNSYLCIGCHNVEDSFHCWRAHWSQNCMDCLQLDRSELCYQVIDCDECYNLRFSQDCTGCRDSAFLYDCKSCNDCLMCTGLRNAQYCIFNQKMSKEEYEAQKKELKLDTTSGIEKAKEEFARFLLEKPHRAVFILNSQNADGDHIDNSKNCHECYHVKNAEDCRYLESCENIKDSMDNTFSGWPAELLFETMSAGVNCYQQFFCTASWTSNYLMYCDSCHHSDYLFGCIGLRKKNKYCILNKQYEKAEYEELCARIAEDMTKNAEWGKFFPKKISPHAYNETIANGFYPLKKSEAEKQGFQWKEIKESPPKVSKTVQGSLLPEKISEVPDDILNWAITCSVTGRPFRIVEPELTLLRRIDQPVPRIHPDERHAERMAMRNPRKLWQRKCAKCNKSIKSTYSPERPETIFCEECYLKEVY